MAGWRVVEKERGKDSIQYYIGIVKFNMLNLTSLRQKQYGPTNYFKIVNGPL